MTGVRHHIPDPLLVAYVSGSLPQAYSLVVATHLSMCDECRARATAHEAVGGSILESCGTADLSGGLRQRVFDMLDEPVIETPRYERSGIFPAPVMEALGGLPPGQSVVIVAAFLAMVLAMVLRINLRILASSLALSVIAPSLT